MTDLEKMRKWIKTFPDGIPDNFQVDFTNEIPQNAGLFPTGTMEIGRRNFINGDTEITNQYNFGLYAVFEKPPDTDEISTQNAEWAMNFQRWVQEQSITRQAPTFGNIDLYDEIIRAQNGLFMSNVDNDAGLYLINITATFKILYETSDY